MIVAKKDTFSAKEGNQNYNTPIKTIFSLFYKKLIHLLVFIREGYI